MLFVEREMAESKLSIDAPEYVSGTFDLEGPPIELDDVGEFTRRESGIFSKINRIFDDAKKRNPEGYTLKFDSEIAISPSSCSTSSVQLSRSTSTSPVNFGATTSTLNPYSIPFYSAGFRAASRNDSIDQEEEKERNSNTKYRNPASGQEFYLFATTVNVPSNLEPID